MSIAVVTRNLILDVVRQQLVADLFAVVISFLIIVVTFKLFIPKGSVIMRVFRRKWWE